MRPSKAQVLAMPSVAALPRVFSGKVEDSLRLRLLGLATLWLVALAIGLEGGNSWTWLGAGIAATCGHAFRSYRRHRSTGMWSIVMVMLVMALAMAMRAEILAALEGDWLPLANFLLLVQAIASFDIRTRGGLYAGLALSGIVLFFASQHAFDLSFVVFLVGYAALLMAFLGTAAVEDETGAAQAPPSSHRIPLVRFWSGTAAAVLIFSTLAFLLLPRGESTDPGYDQVAAAGNSGLSKTQVTGRMESLPSPGAFSEQQDPVATLANTNRDGAPQPAGDGPLGDAAADAVPAQSTSANLNSLAMLAGSPKSSERQRSSYDTFEGAAGDPGTNMSLSPNSGYLGGSSESYGQAYLVQHAQPQDGSTAYGGVVEPSPDGDSSENRVSDRPGTDLPDPVREKLSQVNLRQARYYSLPTSLVGLPSLTREITAGAETDFDTVMRMVAFLRRHGQYDASTPHRLKSSAQLDDLVFNGEGGTDVDFAMALVMVARAAGLPARLAVGYLPGEQWAEIFSQEQGWVPIDSTPHPASMTVGWGEEAGQDPWPEVSFRSRHRR